MSAKRTNPPVTEYQRQLINMLNTPTVLAATQHQHSRAVWEVINGQELRDLVTRSAQERPETEPVLAISLRIISWLHTVGKLTELVDFQALACCARFMFEAHVDLMLLAHCKETPLQRLADHVESTKLDWGEKLNKDESIPETVGTISRQHARDRAEIGKAARERWGLKKHPSHWAGQTIFHAARLAADSKPINYPTNFVEFYRTRYCQLSSHLHSGAVGLPLRGSDSLVANAVAIALGDIVVHSIAAYECALRIWGRWNVVTKRTFEDMKERQNWITWAVLESIAKQIGSQTSR